MKILDFEYLVYGNKLLEPACKKPKGGHYAYLIPKESRQKGCEESKPHLGQHQICLRNTDKIKKVITMYMRPKVGYISSDLLQKVRRYVKKNGARMKRDELLEGLCPAYNCGKEIKGNIIATMLF